MRERGREGDWRQTGSWGPRGGWGVTEGSHRSQALAVPGGERDRGPGLRPVRPLPGSQAVSVPAVPIQTQPQSGPQSRATGCFCRPKEPVRIAVVFSCFPQRIHGRPLKGRGGEERWGGRAWPAHLGTAGVGAGPGHGLRGASLPPQLPAWDTSRHVVSR